MGLYLAIFNQDEDELEGVEVGSYSDYNYFLDAVTENIEKGKRGEGCPTLVLHHDSDGTWSSKECSSLLKEMIRIRSEMKEMEVLAFNSPWMNEISDEIKLKPKNMYESFVDVDGEFLIERIINLCELAIETGHSIYFQ